MREIRALIFLFNKTLSSKSSSQDVSMDFSVVMIGFSSSAGKSETISPFKC